MNFNAFNFDIGLSNLGFFLLFFCRQQDSQEFLRFLLEGINEDLNKAVNASRRSSASLVSPESSKRR